MTATVYLDTWRDGVKRYDAKLDASRPQPHDGDWNGSPSTEGQLWQREAERAEQDFAPQRGHRLVDYTPGELESAVAIAYARIEQRRAERIRERAERFARAQPYFDLRAQLIAAQRDTPDA